MLNKVHQVRLKTLFSRLGWDYSVVNIIGEPVGGTNTTYFVEYFGVRYVVRIASNDSRVLSIDRKSELDALSIACSNRVGARLLTFDENNGDMIMYYEDGKIPTQEELQNPITIKKMVKKLKKLHSCRINHVFNPFDDIKSRLLFLSDDKRRWILKDFFESGLYTKVLKFSPVGINSKEYYGLCHNDPCVNNIILGKELLLIDYEFAGMGNVFFDIASICGLWEYDKRVEFLETYFGFCDIDHQKYLNYFTVLQLLWNTTWGYVKVFGEQIVEIDYLTWANQQLELAIFLSRNA